MWFSRKLKLETRRDAGLVGTWWAVMFVVLQLLITIPNGTTNNVFGAWVAYLVYVAIIAGAMFQRPNRKNINQPTL